MGFAGNGQIGHRVGGAEQVVSKNIGEDRMQIRSPWRRSVANRRDLRPDEGLGGVVGLCDKAFDRRLENEEQEGISTRRSTRGLMAQSRRKRPSTALHP